MNEQAKNHIEKYPDEIVHNLTENQEFMRAM